MPIYEYECNKCGHHVEALQKFSDPPIFECEKCHASMKKLISNSTFHLKGTGWYVTDYASKNRNSQTSAEETSTSDKDTSSKKAEAKGADKKTASKETSGPSKNAN